MNGQSVVFGRLSPSPSGIGGVLRKWVSHFQTDASKPEK